jgi:tetratricopeptide (TPR) repeat protein
MTSRRWYRHPILLTLVATAALGIGGVAYSYFGSATPPDAKASFVGRSSCIECHRDQAQTFTGSHHDLAMDLATDETVLGDFNNAQIEHDGMTSRMFRDGKRFMVHTEGETGKMEDFEVKYVFGVDPLQQYMIEFPPNPAQDPKPNAEGELPRIQVLRLSWDTINRRWFYLRPPDVKDKLAPEDPLHWTGIAQRWQTMCADCHSTNLKTAFDAKENRYHTTFTDIDVSCEACHGPGSLHVEIANRKSPFWDRNHGYGLAQLKGESSQGQLQACAQCHSRRGLLDIGFTADQNYHDFFDLELLQPDTYYADGQIKDEVYVYGSFVQSKMYHKGIRCTDCHDPHSLKLKHPGNETCTSCHQHPAGKYDVPAHHRHAVGTEGAKCVNCHMPGRTYMDVDFRRDHSFRVPRPDMSVRWGTPNACSSCHVNDSIAKVPEPQRASLREYADWLNAAEAGDAKIAEILKATDKWCDEACDKWYGAERKRDPHFGEAIAALRAGDPTGVDAALALAANRDPMTPAIARATALDGLAQIGQPQAAKLSETLIADPTEHVLVRAAAIRTLRALSPEARKRLLIPRLRDELRLVRREAAQILSEPDAYQVLNPNERTQVDLAMREVQKTLMATADRGGAHLAWASLCEMRGAISEAVGSYQTAIRIEPNMAGPRTNLAALFDAMAERGDPQAAAQAEALRNEELPLLARDAQLAPNNAQVQYRYGLALYLRGDLQGALRQIELATKLDPKADEFALALKLLREKIDYEPKPMKPDPPPAK